MLTSDTVLCRMGRTLRKDNYNTLGDNSRILAFSNFLAQDNDFPAF